MAVQRVVIHGGMHKTGSSFIQNTLFGNLSLLRDRGVLVPATGLNRATPQAGMRHSRLRTSLSQEGAESFAVTALLDELVNSDCDVAILSYEGFLAPQFDLSLLRDALRAYDPVLVVYLRNPIDYLESKYREWIRLNDFAGSIERFRAAQAGFLDVRQLIEGALDVFGEDRVVVRPIELVAPRSRLVADLFEAGGLRKEVADLELSTSDNPRADNAYTLSKLMANKLWLAGETDARKLVATDSYDYGGSGRLIGDDLVEQMVDSLWDDYQSLVVECGLPASKVDRQWANVPFDEAFQDPAVRRDVVEHVRALQDGHRSELQRVKRQMRRLRREHTDTQAELERTSSQLAEAKVELAAAMSRLDAEIPGSDPPSGRGHASSGADDRV